jgi:hypothetical protein
VGSSLVTLTITSGWLQSSVAVKVNPTFVITWFGGHRSSVVTLQFVMGADTSTLN